MVDNNVEAPYNCFGTTFANSHTDISGYMISTYSSSGTVISSEDYLSMSVQNEIYVGTQTGDISIYSSSNFFISAANTTDISSDKNIDIKCPGILNLESYDEILLTCGSMSIHFDSNDQGYTFRPKTDQIILLGSGSYRWSNIYTYNTNVAGSLYFTGSSELTVASGGSVTLYAQLNLGYSTSPNFDSGYYINGYGNGRFAGVYTDVVYAWGGSLSSNVNIGSSRRYKENIEYRDTNYWHDKLMQLKPCTFNYTYSKEQQHAGIIAEDLYEVLPEFVQLDEEGNCEGIKMFDFIAVLISETQRANSIIENLQKEIDELKSTK